MSVVFVWSPIAQQQVDSAAPHPTRACAPIWREALRHMTFLALKWRHGSVRLGGQVVRQSERRGAAGGDGAASSRRRSLPNSPATTPIHPHSPPSPPRFPFSVAPIFVLNFRLSILTPLPPLRTPAGASRDVIMRTPCQRWLVSSVLPRSEHLPPQCFFMDARPPFNSVGEGLRCHPSHDDANCTPCFFPLCVAALLFQLGGNDTFASRQSLRAPLLVSRSPGRPQARAPLPSNW